MKTGTGILLGTVILAALSLNASAEDAAPATAGTAHAPADAALAQAGDTKLASAEAVPLAPAGTALASADKALADKALVPADKASADKAAGAARAPADAALAPAHDAIKVLKREEVSFKEEVQPILHDYCVSCHSPGGRGYAKSGLDLRSYEGLMKGTMFGPVVIPGNSEASTFTKLLTGTNKGLKMPMGLNAEGTLDRQYILIMRKWVKQGARNN